MLHLPSSAIVPVPQQSCKQRSWQRRAIASLALAALSLPVLSSPAMTQELLRSLTVTGQGVESIATTKAQVNLGIEVQAKTAKAAQAEAAQRSNAVVDLLKQRQVEKLETTGISLNPRYSYDNNEQTLLGFTATNTVSFRLPTNQAGAIMDDAVGAGATRINGISFTAADEVIAQAEKQALRKAAADAKAQADTVLDALGFEAKEIVNIQVNGAAAPPQFSTTTRLSGVAAFDAAPSPVIGGEQNVQASVTLQIRY
ncbi:MAG: SIMPL domain-containing protein [Synechococcales cyanobacterium RM1_1_8]|nr:SIMPL domain-containing protein [Synechococcales cyanobacterium RM1_1_8]